jgi:hypothetical protein
MVSQKGPRYRGPFGFWRGGGELGGEKTPGPQGRELGEAGRAVVGQAVTLRISRSRS